MQFLRLLFIIMLATAASFLVSCAKEKSDAETLFRLVEPDSSGLAFTNQIQETIEANILTYQYFYNGGGVAVGDVNNDGLEDLYFTSNQGSNKLYLNLGNMKFRDITLATGTGGRENAWATGAVMVDINADGLQDIYVCYSGDLAKNQRRNQLFVNQGLDAQGIPFYKEQAAEFGLDDHAFSTSAYFADLDLDGDLDMLLLNHNPLLFNNLNANAFSKMRSTKDSLSSSKVFQNENGRFRDVSTEVGLETGALSYGLGAVIGDFNEDGWPDIYIGNDYSAPDYYYVNQGDGTFVNQLQEAMGHTSLYSMGVDAADINRDGNLDLISLDMLPEDNKRQKLLHSPENYEHYELFLEVGLHHQLMRNMLQVNNGDGTFSEVGQVAGVSTTDWSWTPLFADFDNDGYTDLFVSNGFLKDFTNLDFINYRQEVMRDESKPKQQQVLDLINAMPATKVSNYGFKNINGIKFSNFSAEWGMDKPSNSNGAVYADLDQDGDLDLILNNLNEPAQVYKNQTVEQSRGQFLQVELIGDTQNPKGIGAKVRLFSGETVQYQQQQIYKGFQGNVTSILHFGLDSLSIDYLKIDWPGGSSQTFLSPKPNQKIQVKLADAIQKRSVVKAKVSGFSLVSDHPWEAKGPRFNDFKRQSQLLYSLSHAGPFFATGDLNGDGRSELIASTGGAYLSVFESEEISSSPLRQIPIPAGVVSSMVCLDVDGDGDLDIYLGMGGYEELTESDSRLQDQLLLNDGTGRFELADASFLPANPLPTSKVLSWDYDGDGQNELFIGAGYLPGRWPESAGSYLLKWTGKSFNEVETIAFKELRRVKDAVVYDLDGDGLQELIVAAEFDRIRVFSWKNEQFQDRSAEFLPKGKAGLWRSLLIEDLDGDGSPELLAGNWGLNTRLKTEDDLPLTVYFADFDQNGSVDPLMTFPIQGTPYPFLSRDELAGQLYRKKALFATHESFSTAGISEVLTDTELSTASKIHAEELETKLFTLSNGRFEPVSLPIEAQYSPINRPLSFLNEKGQKQLLLLGNLESPRLKIGRLDANKGVVIAFPSGIRNGEPVVFSNPGKDLNGEITDAQLLEGSLWVGIRNFGIKSLKWLGN